MPDVPVSLTNSLFVSTFIIATGAFKALYAAFGLVRTDPVFRAVATQRKRYFLLLLGTALSFGPVAFIIWTNGWSQFGAGLDKWWGVQPIGFVVNVCNVSGLISPFFALLLAAHVYQTPAQTAHRLRGRWVPLSEVRRKAKTV
jgi:hypothetical protein